VINNSTTRALGCLVVCLMLSACEKKFDPSSGTAPPPNVFEQNNAGVVTVEKPDQFSLVAAQRLDAPAQLNVTGAVNPDVNREVPVISLASGRVVDIRTRLDDNVKKGQLLIKVQSPDITNAFDTYLKARNDELLANKAYNRTKDLYDHGAVPLSALEQAADTEDDAKADLAAADEQLHTLGVDKDHPSSIVNVYAPISGVIVAQYVTNAAAAGVTYSGSSTAFTIADMSVVWIICDVYENDISKIHLGQEAFIHANAYPDTTLVGHITDIGPILDPTIRTAKVRIEIRNPGTLRLGMFVTATFQSRNKQAFAVVPSSAILHLHDHDWVYIPAGGKQFKRVEVQVGDMLPGNNQQILSGISPGQQVVAAVLQLQATLEAQ